MDRSNAKIITVCLAASSALVGLTIALLLRSFAGAFGVVARLVDSNAIRHGVPVVVGLVMFFVLQFNPRVVTWAEEVVVEIKKVVWPSRKDTTAMTIVTLIMVLISSLIVTGFDFVSGFVMKSLIQ